MDFAIIQPKPCNMAAARGGVTQLIPARRFSAAATALLLIAGASFVFLFSVVDSRAQTRSGSCEDAAELAVLPSPVAPWTGAPLRVIVAAEKPLEGELSLVGPDGNVADKWRERHGGPPYFWFAEVASPAAGKWHARLVRDRAPADCGTITRDISVSDREPARPHATEGTLWPLRDTWSRATENLYSAWIEKLFDAPLDAAPSWPALHEVLRDKSRNALFNHLGLREDEIGLVVRPDCADLPYFLRAYFAFKMGLPYGYSICSRGGGGAAPRCPTWTSIFSPPQPENASGISSQTSPQPIAQPASALAAQRPGLAAAFGRYLPNLANGVHSGSARTLASDNNTDYYPVALRQETLRPG